MASKAALEIHQLHQVDLTRVQKSKASTNAVRAFQILCKFPIASIADLQRQLPDLGVPTLQRAVDKLVTANILREATGKRRNRHWLYERYYDIITRDTKMPIG